MGIGKRIREARELKGLTQKQLGDLVGVTASAITNYENETSHPKEPILYALFQALGKDPNYFFQDCVEIEKPATDNDDGVSILDAELIKLLRNLSPEEADQVRAFVKGLKSRKA
jgi:transcriptional regulator with XRE-family HTH domain